MSRIVASCGGGEQQYAGHNQEVGEALCEITYSAASRQAGSSAQPVDEKTILHFFECTHVEEDKREAMIATPGSGEEDVPPRPPNTKCFSKCSAFEGIPECLGSRLSRRLPGEADFFQINTLDLHAAAAADARLAEIFALLRSTSKPIIRKQQVLEQLHPHGTDVSR
jgi:hypothetical protein